MSGLRRAIPGVLSLTPKVASSESTAWSSTDSASPYRQRWYSDSWSERSPSAQPSVGGAQVTRVAIVSPSSKLRASLAAALGASPAFDVVAVAALTPIFRRPPK